MHAPDEARTPLPGTILLEGGRPRPAITWPFCLTVPRCICAVPLARHRGGTPRATAQGWAPAGPGMRTKDQALADPARRRRRPLHAASSSAGCARVRHLPPQCAHARGPERRPDRGQGARRRRLRHVRRHRFRGPPVVRSRDRADLRSTRRREGARRSFCSHGGPQPEKQARETPAPETAVTVVAAAAAARAPVADRVLARAREVLGDAFARRLAAPGRARGRSGNERAGWHETTRRGGGRPCSYASDCSCIMCQEKRYRRRRGRTCRLWAP